MSTTSPSWTPRRSRAGSSYTSTHRRRADMGKVVTEASMSLDGYIAKQDNTIGALFDWLQNGEVEFPAPAGDITFHLSEASAEHWRRWISGLGALVVGRTLFDFTDGW